MRRKSGAILSNGSVDMLTSAVKSAGMEDVIDHLISVDPIRLFKTSPESYELVQEAIPVNKVKCCLYPVMHGMRWVLPGFALQRTESIGKAYRLKRYLLGRIF